MLPPSPLTVPVHFTVNPLVVQVIVSFFCSCAPGLLAARAGTTAMASATSDSTAMMPSFLIELFLLYSVGLYCSPSTYKDVFTASSWVSKYLVVGLGFLEWSVHSQIKRPAPYYVVIPRRATSWHHL